MRAVPLLLIAGILSGAPAGAFAAVRCEAIFEDRIAAALDQLAQFYAEIQVMTDARARAVALEDFKEKYAELEKQVGSSIRERVTGQGSRIETGLKKDRDEKSEILRAARERVGYFREFLTLNGVKAQTLRNSSLIEGAVDSTHYYHKRSFNRGEAGVEWSADERFVHIHGPEQRTEFLIDLQKKNIMNPKFQAGLLGSDGLYFASKNNQRVTIDEVGTVNRWLIDTDHEFVPNADFVNSKFIILQKFNAVVSKFENFKIRDFRNHREIDLGTRFSVSADRNYVAYQKGGRIEVFDISAWKVVQAIKGEFDFFDGAPYTEGFFTYQATRFLRKSVSQLFDFTTLASKDVPEGVGEIVEVSKDGRYWIGHRLPNRSAPFVRGDSLYDSRTGQSMMMDNGLRTLFSPSQKYALVRRQTSGGHGAKTVIVELATWKQHEVDGNFTRFDAAEENIYGGQFYPSTHQMLYGLAYNLKNGSTTTLGGFYSRVADSPYILKLAAPASIVLQPMASNKGSGDTDGTFVGFRGASISPSGKYIMSFNEDAQGEPTIIRILELNP